MSKAKVEAGVLVAERWILAALRNRIFFSVAELNVAIAPLLARINDRPFRHLKTSRRQLYEDLDRPALRGLPAERYQWIEWKTATVNIDYHVECDKHFYSVPYPLVRERVDIRLSLTTVEMLHKGRRVASHLRSYLPGKTTTCADHMPASHRRYLEWTPSRIVVWAAETGPATAELAQGIMERRKHPEQGFRGCLGLISLGKTYSPERLEAACRRALDLGAYSYTSVKSMLKAGLERSAKGRAAQVPAAGATHENVRGPDYYRGDH